MIAFPGHYSQYVGNTTQVG